MQKKKLNSKNQWLKNHVEDEYVQRAQRDGYRARSVYKLQEIDQKDGLLQRAQTIVDLGAAPGGWCQYVVRTLGGKCRLIALDILEMEPIDGVDIIQADFSEQEGLQRLLSALDGQAVDLVLSDLAPNISGIAASDQARSVHLLELALDFCEQVLRPDGTLLVKAFQGTGFPDFQKALKQRFQSVKSRKPKASRAKSKEIYLLAQGFKA